MPTANDIASGMIDALRLTEPTLDTSIGSLARKIIDAVAGVQAEGATDDFLSTYTYDIDSKTGGDLDDFCAVFGLARLQAQRATGVVTFSRPASIAATRTATIGVGIQVMAMTNPVVYAQTMTSAVMAIGQTSIDVPVQALLAGPAGNVAAGTLTNIATQIDGVTAVTNSSALSNGAVSETDDQLRTRFKATVFRNLAGTDAMYRAMALQVQADPSDSTSRAVTQVNVIGPKKTWIEQVQVVSGVAATTLTSAAYIYPGSVYVGANVSQGKILTPTTQYIATINNSINPATLSIATVGTNMPDGFYDLQFDYVPTYSRNDPLSTRWGAIGASITNRVDIWVNGTVAQTATQSCVFNSTSAMRFTGVTNDPLQASRFIKLNGTSPSINDVFVPLGFGPIVNVPTTLSIGGTNYVLGTHYDIVHQNDAFGYGPTSKYGLVFYAAGAIPASNTPFSITYTYNSVPFTAQNAIESQWRLLGTDVQVHAGKVVQYRYHLAIVFDRTFDQSTVTTNINTAIAAFVNGLGFNSAMQISDLLQVIHAVPGVDNARFLNNTDDGTHYAMEIILPNGSTGTVAQVGGRAVDVYFNDASYPLFHSTRIIAKARNNFGTP
jgi:uncharacterized phage protein gp47/JayE